MSFWRVWVVCAVDAGLRCDVNDQMIYTNSLRGPKFHSAVGERVTIAEKNVPIGQGADDIPSTLLNYAVFLFN